MFVERVSTRTIAWPATEAIVQRCSGNSAVTGRRRKDRAIAAATADAVPLHHASPADPRVLDNASVAVLLAILSANFAAQEHDGPQLSAHWRP
jgi:hypothetical protein